MVAFTPRAVSAALDAIKSADEPTIGLRITAETAGCHGLDYSLGLESEIEEGDEVLEFDGLKVLIDPVSATLIQGTSVDFVEDERGAVFVFNSPSERKGGGGGCGCGGGGHGGGGHGHGHGKGQGGGGCH
jgi:iron-sulfur cluster assembly protein